MPDHLGEQAPQVGPLDSDAGHDLRCATRTKQVDLHLSRSGDVYVSRLMIGGVDHEPKAVRSMDHDRSRS